MSNDFTARADLQVVRYSQVWEDHQVLERALQVGPEDDVLSICSAGCNALALLLQGPRSVTALDVSAAQAALLTLKLAALQVLSHPEFLVLIGEEPGDAEGCYQRVRGALPEDARAFWDGRAAELRAGIVHQGRLERYFRGFIQEHLLRLHPAERVQRLISCGDVQEQRRIFEEELLTPAFREAYVAYFGQENLQARGRDPAQFRYVSAADVGAEFLRRLGALCGRVNLAQSPYMNYFFTGRTPAALRVPYLQPENYPRLQALAPRVRVVLADLGAHLRAQPQGAYSKANLSDIFEYMSAEDAADLLATLGARLRPGGRVAYWNLLVERSSAPGVPGLRPLQEEARRLHAQDRIFFYGAFHLEEIVTP